MQTNVRRFIEERNVIQANPLLAMLRTARFVWVFYLVFVVVLIVFSFLIEAISGQHFSKSPILSPLIPMLVVGVLNLVISSAQVRYWKGIEQRRFAAVHGDR